MTTPPDVLCKWLGDRWETMEELRLALEMEAGLWTKTEIQKESRQNVERMMRLVQKKGNRFAA